MGIGLLKQLALSTDGQLQCRGQRVDHRYTHAVQAARNLVSVVVKLTARVQYRHDDLSSGNALFMLLSGNATAIVRDGHRLIGVDDNVYLAAVPSQRLINTVVDQLKYHVVQAGAIVGVADIHARALAHSIKAFKHLDARRIIVFRARRLRNLI